MYKIIDIRSYKLKSLNIYFRHIHIGISEKSSIFSNSKFENTTKCKIFFFNSGLKYQKPTNTIMVRFSLKSCSSTFQFGKHISTNPE